MTTEKILMKWINVKDRLPEYAGYYLVVTNPFPIEKAEFDGKSNWNYKFGFVTYWMALPKRPE